MTASMFSRFGTRRALLAGCLIVIACIVSGCSSRATIHPDAFWGMIFSPSPAVVNGIGLTVSISILAQAIGVILGVLAAIAKMSKHRAIRTIANLYIWFFRGTPLLVQLMFFYY